MTGQRDDAGDVGEREYQSITEQARLEQRLDRLETQVARTPKQVVYGCHFCGNQQTREIPKSPTDWAGVLFGIREEIRLCALLDAPRTNISGGPPPHDIHAEEGLVASALAGLTWPDADKVQQQHFYSKFLGWVWVFARTRPSPLKDKLALEMPFTARRALLDKLLEQIATDFELKSIGAASQVLVELRYLAGPHVPCRNDSKSVERVLTLAWQREMLREVQALEAAFRQDNLPMEDVKTIMGELRAQMKGRK